MRTTSRQAIDALSASPALRLRHRVLAAKPAQRPAQPVPPAVGGVTETAPFPRSSHWAREAKDPRAVLMLLREEAADEIDRLLEFLDATEGDIDLESDELEEDVDREEDRSDLEPNLGWTIDGVRGASDDDREMAEEPAARAVETARRRYRREVICNVR